MTTQSQELPDPAEVDATVKLITDNAQRVFLWDYDRSRDQLVTLYNKAMSSQWNSVTELDWATDVDPERLVDRVEGRPTSPSCSPVPPAEVPGSPIASWCEPSSSNSASSRSRPRCRQFMHGEQGAMMVAAKIVETVPWIDAKYYASTQTMDEARHTEVFAKYLHTKLGDAYPMSPFLEGQITDLIEDSRWDIAYLGMQIVIESLALAAFGSMHARHRGAAPEEAPPLRHGRRGPPRRLRRPQPGRVLPGPVECRAQGPPGLPPRRDDPQQGPVHDAGDVGTPRRRPRRASLPSLLEGAATLDRSLFASFQHGFFSKLVPERPQARPARCQRRPPPQGVGRRSASCASTTAPTPPRTTSPTTPSPRIGPRRPEHPSRLTDHQRSVVNRPVGRLRTQHFQGRGRAGVSQYTWRLLVLRRSPFGQLPGGR